MIRSLSSTQVKGEDGKIRVDACVNAANVLAAWADVEEATGDLAAATQLLISSVEGYQRSLEQEEDAAVRACATIAVLSMLDRVAFFLSVHFSCHNPNIKRHRCSNAGHPLLQILDQKNNMHACAPRDVSMHVPEGMTRVRQVHRIITLRRTVGPVIHTASSSVI